MHVLYIHIYIIETNGILCDIGGIYITLKSTKL